MTNQIHGHEVIKMMMESNESYSVSSLRAAIISRFGASTRFHTCSAENLTAGELIDFLAQRGKFVAKGVGFTISPDRVCEH
ncbi:MAG: YecH family protein [Opitutaceae bacterium]|nr:YecH family protein [Opitutaceae bacterium]